MITRILSKYFIARAFSLIEILVALTVCCILLVLALSLFKSYILRAELTTCTNHHRQIFGALTAYAADHNGNFPGFVQAKQILSSTGNQRTLPNQLLPFLENPVLYCPGAINRIYERNDEGWYDWIYTNQTSRSGYWHIYLNPNSDHNPGLAETYGRNDSLNCDPRKVLMHCYYTVNHSQSSHETGHTNVLRINGSVETWNPDQYNPARNFHRNFENF